MREVLIELPSEQLQPLSTCLTQLKPISPSERETLLHDFYRLYNRHAQASHPTGERNEGENEVQALTTTRVKAPKPFERIRQAEPHRLLEILAHEPPSIITLLLYYLPRATSAQILAGLTDKTRHEVVMRLVNLRMPTPQVVSRLEQLILEKLADVPSDVEDAERDLGTVSGARTLVEVLGRAHPTVERQVYGFYRNTTLNWRKKCGSRCLYSKT